MALVGCSFQRTTKPNQQKKKISAERLIENLLKQEAFY